MRIGSLKGIYLKYPDVGEPVESIGRINYVFNRHNDRTCLIADWQHLRILLERRAFIPVAVEVEAAESEVKTETANISSAQFVQQEVQPMPKRRRGHPRKRRD